MYREDEVYDKALYNMPMMHLGHKKIESPLVHYTEEPEHYAFEYNGMAFWGDDIVVVDGEIGNVEQVNVKEGYVALGFSFDYARLMAREPYIWTSGYRCKLDGIRHATDEEIALYDEDSNKVGDACDEADRRWKERFINF